MNIVMRAFSGVMSGIKAGFDNLAQYSNGTNSCLSVFVGKSYQITKFTCYGFQSDSNRYHTDTVKIH